ncbi:DUF397 domain-containing protein [Spirillospora sp. NPDC052269]
MTSAARWRKSSHSGHEGGDCVELANLGLRIGVRDSKAPDGPMLVLAAADWSALAHQIKVGAP